MPIFIILRIFLVSGKSAKIENLSTIKTQCSNQLSCIHIRWKFNVKMPSIEPVFVNVLELIPRKWFRQAGNRFPGSWVHSHAPSIRSHRGIKVVWPDFQPMRVPEEPVCVRLFRQKPVFTSLHFKSPVHVHRLWSQSAPTRFRNGEKLIVCSVRVHYNILLQGFSWIFFP